MSQARTSSLIQRCAHRATITFCRIAGAMLLVFALAKFISMTDSAPVLLVPEPVFGFSYRIFLLCVAVFEWCLGCALFFYGRRFAGDCVVAILSFCTAAWLYRYLLSQSDSPGHCPCLGFLTQKIGIDQNVADVTTVSALIFLSVGSFVSLMFKFLASRIIITIPSCINGLCLSLLALTGVTNCSAAAMSSQTGSSQGVRLEGSVVWRSAQGGEPLHEPFSTKFSVHLAGCLFRIEETGNTQGLGQQSFHYDGTNWYYVQINDSSLVVTSRTRFTADGPIEVPLKKPTRTSNPANIAISPNLEPLLPKTTSLLPLWLAFASHCYFAQQVSSRIPPIYYMTGGDLHAAQRVKADRVMVEGRHFISNYTDYWNEELFPKPEVECSGLTNIAMWISGWTNIGPLEVPTGFRFVRYFYNPAAHPKYYQSMDALAKVEKVFMQDAIPSYVPDVPSNTYVIHHSSADFSLNQRPISYRPKDGILKLQPEVDAMTYEGKIRSAGTKTPTPLFLKILIPCIAALVPLVFLVRKLRATGVEKNKQ